MKFAILHNICIFLLSAVSVAPLILSGELDFFLGPAVVALFVLGWFMPPRFTHKTGFRASITAIASILFLAQMVRIAQGEQLATAVIEFTVLLLGIKLSSRGNYKDYQHIVLLSFVALIASTVTSYTLSYAVFFISFTLLGSAALMLTLLRKEMDIRFAKADEVTQQRVLNSKRIVQLRYWPAGVLYSAIFLSSVAIVFTLLPRLGYGMGGDTLFGKKLLGFTEDVQIGDLSKTSKDKTVYLRLWPVDNGQPTPNSLPLRFRGAVFDTYKQDRWSQQSNKKFRVAHSSDGIYELHTHVPRNPQRFKIMQEPTNPSYLFLPQGVHHIQMDRTMHRGRLRFNPLRVNPLGVFKYNDTKRVGIRYTVTIDNSPLAGDPHIDLQPFLKVPENFERIARLAAEWTQGAATPAQKVQRILEMLPRHYQYTKLVSAQERAQSQHSEMLDKFLFEYKRGTCEHFATAATLMLRTQGVPARLVTGFMGAQWNSVGEYYTVNASAAHAWTEVFVNNVWHTVDATPQARSGNSIQPETPDAFSQFMDTLAMRWHEYVIDYSGAEQQALLTALRPSWPQRKNSSTAPTTTPFVPQYLAIIAILILLAAIVFKLKTVSKIKTLLARRPKPTSQHQATALYLLLEKRLRHYGKTRPPHQTPGQYLTALAAEIEEHQPFFQQFLYYYHNARFGSIPFTEATRHQLHQQIRKLTFTHPSLPNRT